MADTNRGQARQENEGHAQATSVWENVVAALGALVVAAAIGFMVYQAVTAPDNAMPHLTIRVDSVVARGQQHLVRFTVRNDGEATAARVQIEGELRADTGTVEKSQTALDYVPAGSQRGAGVIFTKDPGRYQLQLRPVGWEQP